MVKITLPDGTTAVLTVQEFVEYQQKISGSKDGGVTTGAKRLRTEETPVPNFRKYTEDDDWAKGIKRCMWYLNRDGHGGRERRCVNAIESHLAVTYAHGHNKNLELDEFVVVYPVPASDNPLANMGRMRGVETKVVYKDRQRDIILLKAVQDSFGEFTSVLQRPNNGQTYLAWGFSTHADDKLPSQAGYFEGRITNSTKDYRGRLMSSHISWDGDSGGGLFNENFEMIGFLQGSIDENRSLIVPAQNICDAIKWIRQQENPTPFKSKPAGGEDE